MIGIATRLMYLPTQFAKYGNLTLLPTEMKCLLLAIGDKRTILRSGGNGFWLREPKITPSSLELLFFVRGRGLAVGFGGGILSYKPDGSTEIGKSVGN